MRQRHGNIYNIQTFSTTDGPGIRTVVFHQGCNLRCLWCHNPESIPMNPEIGFISEKCIQCGNCQIEKNPDTCYAGALVRSCQKITSSQLWELLKKDLPYYQFTQGGITFSGGECLLQWEFVAEMIAICRENGVHTAVDTAGHVPFEWLEAVDADLYLYDIKALDESLHQRLTGVNGKLIWENLAKLVEKKYQVGVRIPCVPGGNWEDIPAIIEKLKSLGIHDITLLPYHVIGADKSSWYGQEPVLFSVPTDEEMNTLKELLT